MKKKYLLLSLTLVCYISGQLYSKDRMLTAAFYTGLPAELLEISGLVITPGGDLFCHDDEKAVIYQLTYPEGKIKKKFFLDLHTQQKIDFEGIAYAVDTFYLLTSDGFIYAFKEGNNNDYVPFELYNTSLSNKNFEGLCYDPVTGNLLLASKKDYRTLFVFSLKTLSLVSKPILKLNKELDKNNKKIQLSGIDVHPLTGHFFLIDSNNACIYEIDRHTGLVLGTIYLDEKKHIQPEGIAITSGNQLYLCDEGKIKKEINPQLSCYLIK